jgi:long-subunit acyl-CoA synthetase (AMP-forming)
MERKTRAEPSPPGASTVVTRALSDTTIREGRTLRSSLAPAGSRETIPDLLNRNAARFGERPAFSAKADGRYEDRSWRRFREDVVSLGECFLAHGIRKGDRIVILSRNRAEMLVTEFATMSVGAIYVPIFAGYHAEQTRALIRLARPSAIVLADREQAEKIAGSAGVGLIVSFDPVPSSILESDRPKAVLEYGEALARGRARGTAGAFQRCAADVRPDDASLMMYTSGTGGEMKGVLLCHDNILSQQRAFARIWSIGPEDRFLSYLPWHHSFGGIFEKYTALYNGAPVAIDDSLGRDFPLLLQNWKSVKPTVYFSVPTIYQQLVDHARLHPDEEKEIFPEGMKFVFTAAAPLPAGISSYFAERKIPVAEGWGLTETSPCCTTTDLREPRSVPGVVGYPIPEVEIRLADDGEILVRGPNVMREYFENPDETRRVLPGDGWFRTGDLGEIVGNALRLIARKDRIFKLLNGERVIPSPLENCLAGRSPYIRHVVIAGAAQDRLTALIFPNLPLIESEFGDDRERADRVVKESFEQAVRELNETHPVRYERIGAFVVVGRLLSIENGELTPSLKVRVANVLGSYKEYIDAVYQPSGDCDCRFMRRVMRLSPDPRFCFRGKALTLDRCHECGLFVFPDEEES